MDNGIEIERAPRGDGEWDRAASLGEQLRAQRVEHGLSLRELARRLDVSPSLVSQIETGRIQPSVRTLYGIVSKLGISLDEIFGIDAEPGPPHPATRPPLGHDGAAQTPSPHVLSRHERPVLSLETGVRWERLTSRDEPGVEFLHLAYPPGGESAPADALVRHTGREFGTVLRGQLGLTIGFHEYTLNPGDSAFFESTLPHRLHNDGHEPVEAIWVVLDRQG